jgi:hypothetical protein
MIFGTYIVYESGDDHCTFIAYISDLLFGPCGVAVRFLFYLYKERSLGNLGPRC